MSEVTGEQADVVVVLKALLEKVETGFYGWGDDFDGDALVSDVEEGDALKW